MFKSEKRAVNLYLYLRVILKSDLKAPRSSVSIQSHCRVPLFVTLWAIANQAPLLMRFSKQEYWSGLPCPSPGDLLNPGIEPGFPVSPALQADSSPSEPLGKPYQLRTISNFKCEFKDLQALLL